MWHKILEAAEIVGGISVVLVFVAIIAAIIFWFTITANGKNPFM